MPDRFELDKLERLIGEISALREEAIALEREHESDLERVASQYRASAANLFHYLAIRRHDIRDLQFELATLGLSSLGRLEPYVLATLDAVLVALHRLAEIPLDRVQYPAPTVGFDRGHRLLAQRTEELFGAAPAKRAVRVMVTADYELAGDRERVLELVRAGMDVLRINCSKDGPEQWREMAANLRYAVGVTGRPSKVLCDLAGPNPRTGPIAPNLKGNMHLRLSVGDRLLLERGWRKGGNAEYGDGGNVVAPAHVSCDMPEVLDDIEVGQRVLFDDARISGIAIERGAEGVLVEITYAVKDRVKLRAGKSINLPDSTLRVPAMTPRDRRDLASVVPFADMIGLSFVRREQDVAELVAELDRLGGSQKGIVLKIETQQAFNNLPRLMVCAMQSPPIGVMIARGDMGPELGFDRLAEVQEEILWICEAAHVPVIWATQVLESLAKQGIPSRGEVTDAAMSERAECVMLNKGEYIVETVSFLCNVLERMQNHQEKKRPLLRKLAVSAY